MVCGTQAQAPPLHHDVRLMSRTEAGARQALKRTREVLQELRLRLSERKTKLVTLSQAWISCNWAN